MRKRLNKIKNYAINHPIRLQILICLLLSLGFSIISSIMSVVGMRHITGIGKAISVILSNMVAGTFIISALIYPIIVTIYEVIYLVINAKKDKLV